MTNPKVTYTKTAEQIIIDNLRKQSIQQEEEPAEEIPQTISKEGYIYIPSIKLYVAKQKSLLNSNWQDSYEELKKQQSKMLSPLEFVNFLQYLRAGNAELKALYGEITAVREPWRAEFLGASLSMKGKQHYITYPKFNNNSIEDVTEELDKDTSMTDRKISLEGWLDNPTKQGLPRKDTAKGSFYYWKPEAGRVARFGAGPGGAYLGCNGDPQYSDSALGVRSCAEGTKK